MRILRRESPGKPLALAIGSFDGVHRGHRAMLDGVAQIARERGLASGALTFEPLPREYFAPREAPARISSLREKLAAIAASGVDVAIVERFDGALVLGVGVGDGAFPVVDGDG